MTKFSRFAIAMLTMAGMTGLALAGDTKADPKAGAPKADAPKADAPKADPKKADAPKADAKPMEMPKPPQEVADRVKAMSGTWKCDGSGMGMDGKEMKFKGTQKSKSDLDGYWVHDSFEGTMGEGKTSMKFKMEGYSTFDASSKKWRNVFVDNMGGQMVGTGDPMKDGKMDTMSEMMDMRGKGMFKDHMDMSDAKKGTHMWGEESRDAGKTWNKVYDITCKK